MATQCNWIDFVEATKAGLTPVIAVVATYIAWQQWRANALKLKWDRYEKRLKVYQSVVGYLAVVQQEASVKTDDIRQLRIGTAEAQFLFNDEVPSFIDSLVREPLNNPSSMAQ